MRVVLDGSLGISKGWVCSRIGKLKMHSENGVSGLLTSS